MTPNPGYEPHGGEGIGASVRVENRIQLEFWLFPASIRRWSHVVTTTWAWSCPPVSSSADLVYARHPEEGGLEG